MVQLKELRLKELCLKELRLKELRLINSYKELIVCNKNFLSWTLFLFDQERIYLI